MIETEQVVVGIFRDQLGIEVPGPDVDVIEVGLLDSLGLVTLVVELEERLGVRIPFETLDVDDFRTLNAIVHLIDERRAQSEG